MKLSLNQRQQFLIKNKTAYFKFLKLIFRITFTHSFFVMLNLPIKSGKSAKFVFLVNGC